MDFNFLSIERIFECLQVIMPSQKSEMYEIEPLNFEDGRFLVNAKKEMDFQQEQYTQVFGDRHGFVKNVSLLDLLFNEGTNSLAYLKNQSLASKNA